jgi:signal transduction histidine kinase
VQRQYDPWLVGLSLLVASVAGYVALDLAGPVTVARGAARRIFEPFVQVGRSLSNPGEGTGLGLAISRHLARGMGGDLAAERAPGRGSRFTLRLRRPDP